MKNKSSSYFLVFLGALLFVIGLFLIKTTVEPQGIMKALPYVFIGLGCGIFGQRMGNIISRKVMKNNPDIVKQLEINKKDERNIAISNLAKAKAYDSMIFIFGALMLSFALMGVDTMAILLLVAAYLFVIVYGLYYLCKYNKEM